MRDTQRRPWAKLSETEAGDLLEVDGGFTCMHHGEIKTVLRDRRGLFVLCQDGHHYLNGEHLVGLYDNIDRWVKRYLPARRRGQR